MKLLFQYGQMKTCFEIIVLLIPSYPLYQGKILCILSYELIIESFSLSPNNLESFL